MQFIHTNFINKTIPHHLSLIEVLDMKKAQGISLNAIIIATLALLVLVVLAMIFTGRIGIFTKETKNCGTLGNNARCVADASECAGSDQKVMNSYTCPTDTSICCLNIAGEEPNFGESA